MNVLALDIGGTAVKIGIINERGDILYRKEHSVSFDGYQTPILDTSVRYARQAAEDSGLAFAGIGISATGQIDLHSGTVIGTCGNLPGWVGVPLKDVFEAIFGLPAMVMNDADCALLGESRIGAAMDCRNVLMVTLGTGVGGGVMADGKILGGRNGLAGEIGHMIVQHKDGNLCTCGNRGCFEQYASVTALLTLAEQRLGERPANARELFDRAEAGEEAVKLVLDTWREAIVHGLVGLVHLFDPELILIGGGVSRQEKNLVQPIGDAVRRQAMPRFSQGLRVEAAALGNDAGMIGAAFSCLEHLI